ncbi:MAG: hypothetical protein ABIJ72_01255 [bacterium]
MQTALIWASNILVFSSYLAYEWAMIKGRARPHRTTRLVLSVIIILGFFSMYAQGDRVVVWFLGICAVQSFVMLIMSIKWGMGGWAKNDLLALAIAIIGIVTWQVTDNPVLGLYAAVTADLAGMIPALVKTYHLPNTEYWLTYVFDLSAILLTGFAIQNGGFNDYLYPVYLLLVNSLMMIFLLRRPKAGNSISTEYS